MINKKALSTRGLVGKLGDVRKQNNFVLHIEDITVEGNSLDLIIQQAFLPQVSLNVLNLQHGNDSIKLAGVASWQGGSITVIDTLSRAELDVLLDWFNKTYDTEERVIGLASEYKKNGYVIEYAGDRRYQRKWPIRGMWISSPNLGTLNASSGEMKELSFTIEIDPSPLKPEYYDATDSAWSDK